MANQENKSFVDTILDTQKQFVNTVVENTKKFTNGNNIATETVDKGSEWYQNWLENQKAVLGQTADKATSAADKAKEGANQVNEFYQNWLNTQTNWAKQMWEMNLGYLNNARTATTANPFEQMTSGWNNATSQWNNWMSQVSNMNTWINNMNGMQNQFQAINPLNAANWKTAADNTSNIFNQWSEMLNNNFGDWQKNFQTGTIQDAYRNLVNTTDGFTRFFEMWAPMLKSIQEKTFNMEEYRKMINPAAYKEFLDKFFSFMPENTRQYAQQMTEAVQNGMKQMTSQGANGYNQMRQMFGNMMPQANGSEVFGNIMNAYTNMHSMLNNAFAPMSMMATPSKHTKSIAEWQDIANRMVVFSIKNAELQYAIYNQGTKVMDALAENVAAKIQNGEEVNSIMALYQEWMNISDKSFVSLFESDAYSQLMAEVSALQLKLRKDMELQTEKLMSGLPIATRTEMDELYKTIYDLKKEVRQLEKMMEIDPIEAAATPATEEEEAKEPKATRGSKKAS